MTPKMLAGVALVVVGVALILVAGLPGLVIGAIAVVAGLTVAAQSYRGTRRTA